jgi:hypothetical protein
MILGGDEFLHASYYCAAEIVHGRRRSGAPIPQWLREHHQRLDAAIRGMSPRGQHVAGNASSGTQSQDAVIGTRQAAQMLNMAPRQVRRHAQELGGMLIGDRWLFSRQNVADYAARGGTDA